MTAAHALNRGRDWARRVAICVAADWRLTAEMLVWRLSLPVLKRIVPVQKLAVSMVSAPRAASGTSAGDRRIGIIRQIAENGGRLLISNNCLERSLVLYRLLAREGADVALVLGVRPHNDANDVVNAVASVAGHAWVELNGRPLDERQEDPYSTVLTFRPHQVPSAAWSSRPTAT